MNRLAYVALSSLFTWSGAIVHAAESSISWNMTPEARYEDNIGLAPDSQSKRDDVTLRLAGTFTWQPIQTVANETTFNVTPFYDGVQSLTNLSKYGVSIGVTQLHQFGNAFGAPWIELHLEGTWLEYEDSELRDGYKGEAKLSFGKRFNPKFSASLGYRYQLRRTTDDNPEGSLAGGNSDQVFHQDRDGPFIRADFTPTSKTTIFAEYSFLQGDVASTGNIANFQNGALFDRARDFAFEEGIRFQVWKIDADQHIYSLGLSQEITDRFSLEISASRLDASTDSGNDYENLVFSAALAITL